LRWLERRPGFATTVEARLRSCWHGWPLTVNRIDDVGTAVIVQFCGTFAFDCRGLAAPVADTHMVVWR
jgi:hypothetical protein